MPPIDCPYCPAVPNSILIADKNGLADLNPRTPPGTESPGVARTSLFQLVRPYIAVAAVIVTGSMLIAAIYFTLLDLEWVGFLGGIVFASILAMTTQAARSELSAAESSQRLALAEYKLGEEVAERESLQLRLAAAATRLQFSDELVPAMLAFVGPDTRFQYHNRAFAEALGLPAAKIIGQHMRDVMGRKEFAEVEPYIEQAASGQMVRYERTARSAGGGLCRVAVQYLPRERPDGKYAGFHIVRVELPRPASEQPGALTTDAFATTVPDIEFAGAAASARNSAPDKHSEAWMAASRSILAAIDGDEFGLLYQKIAPLSGNGPAHYEVLIRLLEEESGQIPPGAFFPLAEEHGLLPRLDRWVFAHVLDWMASPDGAATVRAGGLYFVNIASVTLADPDFPDFVEAQLHRTGVPASALCVEIAEADLHASEGDAVAFTRAMKQCGCKVAISGFGHNRATAQTLKLVPVDFIKIDGDIVRQILKYPAFHARAVAIVRMARSLGVHTVAEMVEEAAVFAELRALDVDFGQGFGISLPQPLAAPQITPSASSSFMRAVA